MTNDEAREIIVNNWMNHVDFAKRFNISTSNAIRIFQHLDLKRCSKGKNCVNSDGPIQSRQNFYSDKHEWDKLNRKCIYCLKKIVNYNYQNNKEQCKQRSRQYHQNNKKHRNQLSRQYWENNRKFCNQKEKEYIFSCAKFDLYDRQISYIEETRQDPNNLELLQVKCAYCNVWFNPTNSQVRHRIDALEGKKSLTTENRFYCSKECKQACPIYRQREYSKDDPRHYKNLGTSREVQSGLRQLVFERDNWTCQRCNTYKDNLAAGISLHCHHKEGIRWESVESADTDMCMTACSECHKKIHQIPGCTYQDFQCKPEED